MTTRSTRDRTCQVCGIPYRASYPRQRTCSRAHGIELRRMEGTLGRNAKADAQPQALAIVSVIPQPHGTTASRGYDNQHKRHRAALAPVVERGEAYCQQPVCVMPSRWIPPGSEWHLGHSDDRSEWLGPVHSICNTADAGRRGAITRRRKSALRKLSVGSGFGTSRQW